MERERPQLHNYCAYSKILITAILLLATGVCFSQANERNGKCECSYPTILFKNNSYRMDAAIKRTLIKLAAYLKNNSACRLALTSFSLESERHQSLSHQRLSAIRDFLIKKEGLGANRIIDENIPGGGNKNLVLIKCK